MADNGKHVDNGGVRTDKSVQQPYASRTGEQKVIFKAKHRAEEFELPEPPPDPWTNSWHAENSRDLADIAGNRHLDEDEDIISYLNDLGSPPCEGQSSECPSRNSVTSAMAVTRVYADDVFEHLGRLYTFAEQILELRNRNKKLFKRVRNLERLRVLQAANQKLENAFLRDKDAAIDNCDEDTGFAESLLDAMLSNCRDPPFQKRHARSIASRQGKNKLDTDRQPPSSTYGISGSVPKVSKWTRVKAAFKWERACTNDAEITDATATTTPTTTATISFSPVAPVKYHKVAGADIGELKCSSLSSCINEVHDSGTPLDQTSFTSLSNEGFYEWPRQSVAHNFESQSSKSESGKRGENKNCRNESIDNDTATLDSEQVKNSELTNEMTQRNPLIRITSEKSPTTCSSSKLNERDTESRSKATTPILTIRIPSREEDAKCTSSPESHSPLFCNANIPDGNSLQHRRRYQKLPANKDFKRQQSLGEESIIRSRKMQDSKWNKVRRAFLTNSTLSVPSNLIGFAPKQMLLQDEIEASVSCNYTDSVEDIEKMTRLNNRVDTRRDYQALREKLGTEFHRKLAEWERLKNMPTLSITKDSREMSSNFLNPRENLLSEERLTPDFKKKLQDWKRVKKIRRGSAPFEQQRINRRRLTDWQLWRSPSNRNKEIAGFRSKYDAGEIIQDGKSHLCEDFVRKMEAWRKMNETNNQDAKNALGAKSRGLGITSGIDESEFLSLERVLSIFNNSRKKGRREDDVQQLDECFDGDARLYTDGTQSDTNPNEVLVRTSVGSYRFEGISREFTRKLYDWERYRGISPTSSTFRLLGPAYTPLERQTAIETSAVDPALTSVECDEPVLIKVSRLKRSKSVGSLTERSKEKGFFLRRSNSLRLLGFPMNKRFQFVDCASNLAVSMDPQATGDTAEDTMDDSEPEAMIVDIEDVIEETASPLERVQPRQTPVYSVAASETTSIAVPLGTVTSSHEPSPIFLIEMEDSMDENHWPPKVCNQRKSFSSEGSSSMEHFVMTNRNGPNYDDMELGNWSNADSLNQRIYNFHDRTDKPHTESDKNSVKSNGSISSMELVASKDNDVEKSMAMANEMKQMNFFRGVSPVASMNEDNENESIGREHDNDAQLRLARRRRNQDSSSEDGLNGRDDNHLEGNSKIGNNEMDVAEVAIECSNDYEEVIVNRDDPRCCAFRNIQSVEDRDGENGNFSPQASTACRTSKVNHRAFNERFSYTSRAVEKSKRIEENYGVIRDQVPNGCRGASKFELNRSAYDYWNGEDESDRSKEAAACVRSTVNAERQAPRDVENATAFLTIRATNSCTGENHREPTIRTTAYTVAPRREERCFERIIINEETLNKIVVPTAAAASTGDAKASSNATGCSATEGPTEGRKRRCDANRDAPINPDAGSKKQNSNSPGRNVFIKTKRIIFSPFRRSEERSGNRKEGNAPGHDQLLSAKGKSKSGSASPKINRQDALLRMSLSLPWPLRSSSRDRDGKSSETERNDKEKRTVVAARSRERREPAENSEKSRTEEVQDDTCPAREKGETPIVQARHSSFEFTRRRNELQYSIKQRNRSANLSAKLITSEQGGETTSFRSSLPTLKDEDEINGAVPFGRFDPRSSDLMYKLNILSSVVAKRDGRTDTIREDSPVETHSLRIRRAKEDFLSRRGGPLCHSALDPPSIGDDSFRRPAARYRDGISEDREEARGQGIKEMNDILSTPGLSNKRDGQTVWTKRRNAKECVNDREANEMAVSMADRIKSASAGMINVDPDTFVRLTDSNRGCESLPRSISKQRQPAGPIAKIVGRLRFARLIRGKEGDEEKSTISKLCRQSLLIDVRNDFERRWGDDDRRKFSRVEFVDEVKRSE